ncbi:hypothetical protein QOZ99_003621 [Angulomicrobium amanitiforme]|uniref:Arc family DNA-binding protein n=2 Tax=Ancylobacter amanitiformis TaxID=217069 RepID=A0ABU0LVL4_9HYPH|nr:hypothetical protein [Ancylobacter amanitiformis]
MRIRLPPGFKAFIETQASRNGSSQNSEIVRCIRERMDCLESGAMVARPPGENILFRDTPPTRTT